jgi:hypothetical protein
LTDSISTTTLAYHEQIQHESVLEAELSNSKPIAFWRSMLFTALSAYPRTPRENDA